jgi:hypothetical protein
MTTGEWVLIAMGVLVAGVLGRLWRGAEGRLAQQQRACEKLDEERDDLSNRLARESSARKKQGEELATLRKRADKAKKRSARVEKGAQDLPLGTAARVADLDAQIVRAERERDQSRTEREQLSQQVAELEARLEVSLRPPPVEPAPAADPLEEGGADASEELGRQLAESGLKVSKLEEALGQARQAQARMRKRISTQEELYASVRSELEVKKDRLRTQEEQIQRLQALEVVVADMS